MTSPRRFVVWAPAAVLMGHLQSCLVLDAVVGPEVATRGAEAPSRVNSKAGLGTGEGRVLADNPIIVTGNHNLEADYDMNRVVASKEAIVPISLSPVLEMDCLGVLDVFARERGEYVTRGVDEFTVDGCFKNLKDKREEPLVNEDRLWGYDANSPEFLEVNTFGHSRMTIEKWLADLAFFYQGMAYDAGAGLAAAWPTSLPRDLFQNGGFWFQGTDRLLVSHSGCDEENKAFYSPAENRLCYGYVAMPTRVPFAQDPSIIYHEIGHALQEVMLNLRNFTAGTALSADMGRGQYDEAGAIGEGVSDYFSFYMNGRPHFGEWALGRFLGVSRPLTEDDPLHAPGVSTDGHERIAYPDYLVYEPNSLERPVEGVHNAGMIISHYLHALTGDLEEACSWEARAAARFVMGMLTESYAEWGDLGARGSDGAAVGTVNLDPANAWDWVHKVNPINYRRFAQTMARKLHLSIGEGGGLAGRSRAPLDCGGGAYPKERVERLLDSYGLLLFDTYNLDGNGAADGHAGPNLLIDPANRARTLMIGKRHLGVDAREGAPTAYVLDKRNNMAGVLHDLKVQGIVEVSEKIDSDLSYNNGNGRVSPGELVGVVPNLYNFSNVPMGGVQVLANDWDHVKVQTRTIHGETVTRGFPCNNLGDGFPEGLDQGAADLSAGEGAEGGCDYTTRSNGGDPALEPREELAPACLVQMPSETETTWVQQDEFLRTMDGFDREDCLGDDPKACLVRVVRGGDQAWIAQIPARSSWSANLRDEDDGFEFKPGHLILLETSVHIPVGTVFLCRFRARFTNCDDCFHDARSAPDPSRSLFDDYRDFEHSGARPFKILNFRFTVID